MNGSLTKSPARRAAYLLGCAAGLSGFAAPLAAQSTLSDVAAFASRRLHVIVSGDTAAYRRLLHPNDQQCLATHGGGGALLQTMVRFTPDTPPRADLTAADLTPLHAIPSRGMDSLLAFPTVPTHQLDLTYRPDSTDSRTVRVLLAVNTGRWVEIVGCPTPRGVAEFTRRAEALDRRWDDADRARGALPDSVAGAVRSLIREGRRIEAIHAVQAALPEISLAVARDVVSLFRFNRKRR